MQETSTSNMEPDKAHAHGRACCERRGLCCWTVTLAAMAVGLGLQYLQVRAQASARTRSRCTRAGWQACCTCECTPPRSTRCLLSLLARRHAPTMYAHMHCRCAACAPDRAVGDRARRTFLACARLCRVADRQCSRCGHGVVDARHRRQRCGTASTKDPVAKAACAAEPDACACRRGHHRAPGPNRGAHAGRARAYHPCPRNAGCTCWRCRATGPCGDPRAPNARQVQAREGNVARDCDRHRRQREPPVHAAANAARSQPDAAADEGASMAPSMPWLQSAPTCTAGLHGSG